MVAFVLSASRSPSIRAWLWGGAAVLTLAVGASRVYLGAHWLTDVLGGYALGATWLAAVIAVTLWTKEGLGRSREEKGTADADASRDRPEAA